jgi:transposase
MIRLNSIDRVTLARTWVRAHVSNAEKYASGETDRNGGITNCGDAAVRAVLYQSALALLTRSKEYSAIRVWGLGIAKRGGFRRAAVAQSHASLPC